ncbi:hypothetical protein GBA52_026038 [Prunus armeniaca]|nr:hypothetical protein GBA52_026038 [Prunus armeniaca]
MFYAIFCVVDVELDKTSEEEEQTGSESDEDLDENPNVGKEDEESYNNLALPRMCTPEHSFSESKVKAGNYLKKRKLSNFKDLIPSIDMKNLNLG